MQSVSLKGVENKAICWMNIGTCGEPFRFSIAVAVNAVAETTFVPFAKISAVLPFHLIAILVVSVVVVYKLVLTPATILSNDNLELPVFRIRKPSFNDADKPVFINIDALALSLI